MEQRKFRMLSAWVDKREAGKEEVTHIRLDFFNCTFMEALGEMEEKLVKILHQEPYIWEVSGLLEGYRVEDDARTTLNRQYIGESDSEEMFTLKQSIVFWEAMNEYGEYDDEVAELYDELMHLEAAEGEAESEACMTRHQ